jgi:hypothetical protein
MVGTFRGSPEQIKPLAGDGLRGVYMLYGLTEVFRARMVRGMGLYGAFPMINRREMDLHIVPCGSLEYPG